MRTPTECEESWYSVRVRFSALAIPEVRAQETRAYLRLMSARLRRVWSLDIGGDVSDKEIRIVTL
jgi:hypothetical protein